MKISDRVPLPDVEVSRLAAIIKEWVDHPGNPYIRRPPEERLREDAAIRAKEALRLEFARRHGWHVAGSPFSAEALRRGVMRAGGYYATLGALGLQEYGLLDHLVWFRWPNRRAAGLVSQPYGIDRDGAVEWATAHGLRAEFPDYPAWHYPGACTLVVFTPKEASHEVRS